MDKTAIRFVSAFDTIDELVFCGLMLALPFGWQLSIIPNILFLVLLFRKALLDHHRPSKDKLLYFAPMLVFLLASLISLFYSSDLGHGGDYVFKRLNLFIIPLGFVFVDFNPSLARRGMRFFVLGSLIAAVVSIAIAFSNSILFKDQMLCIAPIFEPILNPILDTDIHNNRFLGANLSYFMHPGYFAMLMAVALMALLSSYVNEPESWIIQKGGIPAFVFIGLVLALLSTNGAILMLGFLIIYLLIFAATRKQSLDMMSSWLVVFAILLATALFFNPQLKNIMSEQGAASLMAKQKTTEACIQIIKENPVFGVGLGDVDDALDTVYKQKGYLGHSELKLNPHNQFLQTYAAMGLLGVLSLIWLFVSIIKHGFKHRTMMLWGFAIVGIIGFSFESMLNRYWGVLAFSLFYSIFYFIPLVKESEDS